MSGRGGFCHRFLSSGLAALAFCCLSCALSLAADERALPGKVQSGAPAVRTAEGILTVKRLWERLLPERQDHKRLQEYCDATVLRSLDPQRYPLLYAADGGVMLLDPEGTLPVMVKGYIQQKELGLRVVSGVPGDRKRFYDLLFAAGKFLFVDGEVSLAFGEDPTVVAYADYKIEKKGQGANETESVLVNVDEKRGGTPPELRAMLEERGFRTIDASPPPAAGGATARNLSYVSAREPLGMVDSLLRALAVSFDTDREIAFAGGSGSGAKQVARVARYFELNGRRFAVAIFKNDPADYTLLRLLETNGYQVVLLDAGDDLRRVSGKLLPRLGISARYGRQDLFPEAEGRYNVRMFGVMLTGGNGGSVFLTDKAMEKEVGKLLEAGGYRIAGEQRTADAGARKYLHF